MIANYARTTEKDALIHAVLKYKRYRMSSRDELINDIFYSQTLNKKHSLNYTTFAISHIIFNT